MCKKWLWVLVASDCLLGSEVGRVVGVDAVGVREVAGGIGGMDVEVEKEGGSEAGSEDDDVSGAWTVVHA